MSDTGLSGFSNRPTVGANDDPFDVGAPAAAATADSAATTSAPSASSPPSEAQPVPRRASESRTDARAAPTRPSEGASPADQPSIDEPLYDPAAEFTADVYYERADPDRHGVFGHLDRGTRSGGEGTAVRDEAGAAALPPQAAEAIDALRRGVPATAAAIELTPEVLRDTAAVLGDGGLRRLLDDPVASPDARATLRRQLIAADHAPTLVRAFAALPPNAASRLAEVLPRHASPELTREVAAGLAAAAPAGGEALTRLVEAEPKLLDTVLETASKAGPEALAHVANALGKSSDPGVLRQTADFLEARSAAKPEAPAGPLGEAKADRTAPEGVRPDARDVRTAPGGEDARGPSRLSGGQRPIAPGPLPGGLPRGFVPADAAPGRPAPSPDRLGAVAGEAPSDPERAGPAGDRFAALAGQMRERAETLEARLADRLPADQPLRGAAADVAEGKPFPLADPEARAGLEERLRFLEAAPAEGPVDLEQALAGLQRNAGLKANGVADSRTLSLIESRVRQKVAGAETRRRDVHAPGLGGEPMAPFSPLDGQLGLLGLPAGEPGGPTDPALHAEPLTPGDSAVADQGHVLEGLVTDIDFMRRQDQAVRTTTQDMGLTGIEGAEGLAKAHWQGLANTKAELEGASTAVDQGRGIAAAYGEMHAQNPDAYAWAGLAAKESGARLAALPTMAAGMADAAGQRARAVYDEMAWQQLAFSAGGIEQIRGLAARGELKAESAAAWESIAAGIESGDSGELQRGNLGLLAAQETTAMQVAAYSDEAGLFHAADRRVRDASGEEANPTQAHWQWLSAELAPAAS